LSSLGPGATRRNAVLGLLVIAQFVVLLDFSIVQIALPTIRSELDISIADSQWLVSAYGITFAGLLLLSARAADSYGRRRFFSAGLFVFAVASLAGGLSPSELVLIVSRALQGVGAAMASSTALSLLQVNFPQGPERTRALSVFAAVSSAGFAAGVILGGTLTAAFGWRSVFFINVPIGIIAAILSPRVLRESKIEGSGRHLDLPGALLVTSGLTLLVYALTEAANVGLFTWQPLSFLGLSALVLVGFLIVERRAKSPLLPLSFLERRIVLGANALALLRTAAQVSMIFLLTIFLQQVQSFSPLAAGLSFLPMSLVFMFAGGYLASRLVARFGNRFVLIAGMATMAAGFLLLSRITPGTSYVLDLLPSTLIIAFGGAISFTAMNLLALSAAARGEEGLASGLVNTSTQVGGPIGLAIAVTIVGAAEASAGVSVSASASLVAGFGYAFLGAAGMSALGVVIAAAIGHPSAVVTPTEPSRLKLHEPIIFKIPSQVTAPTAVEQGSHRTGLRKILVAVDGSDDAAKAAETAIGFAKDYGAELIVLRVVKTPTSFTPATPTASGGASIMREYLQHAQEDARKYVDGVVAEAREKGVAAVKGEVLQTTTRPATAILARGMSETVDLIVIGSRGLDRTRRFILGSVSAGVAANPNIATLVVK
jgi:EmrB/QacA subfamily drug resistance transporter